MFAIPDYGREVKANTEAPFAGGGMGGGRGVDSHPGRNTVTFEARFLRSNLLELLYH